MRKRVTEDEIPDELNYTTSVESSLQIMRAINEILFLEKFRQLAPAIAAELVKAGVDFSKAKLDVDLRY
jgi:hypothetical protein